MRTVSASRTSGRVAFSGWLLGDVDLRYKEGSSQRQHRLSQWNGPLVRVPGGSAEGCHPDLFRFLPFCSDSRSLFSGIPRFAPICSDLLQFAPICSCLFRCFQNKYQNQSGLDNPYPLNKGVEVRPLNYGGGLSKIPCFLVLFAPPPP